MMFQPWYHAGLTFLVGAVYGLVGEVVNIDEAGVKTLEVGDYRVEVYSGFRWKGEGPLDRSLGFISPQLSWGGN